MTPFLLPLEEIKGISSHQFKKRFGGKAYGLFEAKKLGLPIPPTWLLSSDSFDEFVLPLPTDVKNFQEEAIRYLSSQFSRAVDLLPNALFAVRSSSQNEDSVEHSFAGIFESCLHVPKAGLFAAIAQVWDSCHSLRSTAYIKETGPVRMGVIIQPMIEAKYAGVCFSKHPSPSTVFENHHIVIEFAPTSGEKIVQGEVTPSRFSGTVDSITIATDAKWVQDLIKAVLALKNQYRREVDIEFVVDKSETFILVQQRPVSRSHASHVLDLSQYLRKYKRSLASLDVELLIDGCVSFLSPYLELSIKLERWMAMITSPDGKQELWVHKLLDELVITKLREHFEEEHEFLDTIEKKYQHYLRIIQETDYSIFFKRDISLEKRFCHWWEFMRPLAAHYYVPMFIIDALGLALLREMKTIDAKHAEADLFFLGSFEITSLMEELQEELRKLHNVSAKELKQKLSNLANKYGFLRCHQVYEEGYTPEELEQLMEELPEKGKEQDGTKWKSLHKKYISTPFLHLLLEKFRLWLKIRNTDMEYYMYAVLHSRPLFQEIAECFSASVKDVWNSSQEMILKAIQKGDASFLYQVPHQNLIIYHSYGKTRLTGHVKPVLEVSEKKDLHGKKVYGEGKIEAIVHIAFSPQELQTLKTEKIARVLVTGMTTPDFIPFLKKHFRALITDEGGILCHAAIVARENAIPCIVGTGIATNTLKNGMRVLLDLDTGNIEIVA